MAELETAPSECCSPAAQESCCDPSDKSTCCAPDHPGGCGCSASDPTAAASLPAEGEIRETVRGRYAGLAREALSSSGEVSWGCGNPTAVAELNEGETVLDLGSGGGLDVLVSAQRVGPSGRAYGLDMTDEMLELARRNRDQAGVENAEFLRGTIESIPLADNSVDVIISNCVINLSADKAQVLREAARVLRPGGRFAVTDVIADPDMDAETRRDMQQWTGCIAGALTEADFRRELDTAGFTEVEIRETHRVHDHAGSAIIRAALPA